MSTKPLLIIELGSNSREQKCQGCGKPMSQCVCGKKKISKSSSK